MIKLNNINLLITFSVAVVVVFFCINKLCSINRPKFQVVNGDQRHGFQSVDCWFDVKFKSPRTECYYMHVPEDHSLQTQSTNVVAYPVVVFRSNVKSSTKAPVLHLGAGGPGAPMWLNSSDDIAYILEVHGEMSIKQGRDLFVIDPRGTGLSKPLLTCDKFVEREETRLNENLSFVDYSNSVNKDYLDCIDKFNTQGVDLSNYNSLSIAKDIEMMRIASKVEQWVLVGVSYSATYAQIVASQYPSSIESMVLDSSTFPSLKRHDNFLQKTMASYESLYNYCNYQASCNSPIQGVEQRIWRLHKELNNKPIKLEINHPYQNKNIVIQLNGERFISSLLNGVYGIQIFNDLPEIIVELEARRANKIVPYLENFVAFLLDTTYGDVSILTHYCYEDKKYIDFDLIRNEISKLPKGYIQDAALDSLEFQDYCDYMQIESGGVEIASAIKTDIPTLFLHGEFDTITPLSDVTKQRASFSQNYLVTYQVSHDVLGSERCSQVVAAKFIKNTTAGRDELNCR